MSDPKSFRDEPCPGVLHDIERERPRLRHDVIWCPVCRDAEAEINTGEIGVLVGMRSPSTVHGHIEELKRKGLVKQGVPGAMRTLVLVSAPADA